MVNIYNREQRKRITKVLFKRKRLLINSPLLNDERLRDLPPEDYQKLKAGEWEDKEFQVLFNKASKLLEEVYFIDLKIAEIKEDLATKYKNQHARKD